jgi:hypothetical protein
MEYVVHQHEDKIQEIEGAQHIGRHPTKVIDLLALFITYDLLCHHLFHLI